ncbi:hypothetical protein SH668x_000371 [Planctomicrobium sp. SH668]|uniref:hypothetical protein n=1 Tax=Planctomicrobium sp. SH668 TaxID=3448126 RepID=UPI003F5B6C58
MSGNTAMQRKHSNSLLRLSILACCLAVSSGCQMLNISKIGDLPSADSTHPVVEIVTVWQPGEGNFNGLPTRGFAGQIMFFAMGEKSPVKVNGSVRIYVFDNVGTPEEQEKPIDEFEFDAASFQTFLAPTNLGASYQLFIPYTRKGTHLANCQLRVRYTPEDGSKVYSKMAAITLAGTTQRKPNSSVTVDDVPQEEVHKNKIAQVLSEKKDEVVSPSEIVNAVATTENEQAKKRLRNSLTEAAKIPANTAEVAQASHETTVVVDEKPVDPAPAPRTPMKLHPLLNQTPVEQPKSDAPATTPDATPPSEPAAVAKEEPASEKVIPAAEPAKPAMTAHPLLDN